MQKKNFRKRQGVSLKKMKAFNLSRDIELSIKKDEEQAEKISLKKINSIRNISSKNLLLKSKTSRNTKHESNPYLEDQKPKKFHHHRDHSKFSKLPLNFPIAKCDENVQHIVEQITPKANGFYRFGMKSYQKQSHKRVFSDVMNLPKQDMKGLMFIGELWSNNMSAKYMKENKVNMNKMKFFQKLRDLKWEKIKKERQKELDSSNLITSLKEFRQKSQKSIQSITHFESLLSLKHFQSTSQQDNDTVLEQEDDWTESHKRQRSQEYERNSKTFKDTISLIRNEIDDQCKRCKGEDYWKNMKGLEKESQQMHKLWDKYFDKMLQMN